MWARQGLRNAILTATKGTAVLNTNFLEYAPWVGDISMREFGSLTAFATGDSSTYALLSIETRGKLFIGPGEAIYEGQVCSPAAPAPTRGSRLRRNILLRTRSRPVLKVCCFGRSYCHHITSDCFPASTCDACAVVTSLGGVVQNPASVLVVQVIGIHQRAGDLAVNACKRKAATNIRRYASCTGLLNLHRSASPLSCDHIC